MPKGNEVALWATRGIKLNELPTKERELLMKLLKQLYSFIEVRFYVCNEPTWEECQGERSRYTKAPVTGKI